MEKKDPSFLERCVAISTIVGAVAAIIALWPLLSDSRPIPKGITVIQADVTANNGQILNRIPFYAGCNGTDHCSIACDHSLFGDFAVGSTKQCPVSYTCYGDTSNIQHVVGFEPNQTILQCETPSTFWRNLIIALAIIVIVLSGIFFSRRRFSHRAVTS